MPSPVHPVAVALPHPALPRADWADAYRTIAATPFADARAAGDAAFSAFPFWVTALLALRNFVVAPLGLKTGARAGGERVGMFPLCDEIPRQLVVGLDDRHLDFRCVVSIDDAAAGQHVEITTLIDRHNRLGATYLALVLPFHRLIIRTILASLARKQKGAPG